MTEPTLPRFASINLADGAIVDAAEVIVRRLSDMPASFHDQRAVQALLVSDPVLYRVYMPRQPGGSFGLYTATSVIEPGRVGDEYYMTKGHFHVNEGAPEVYLTLSGEGKLLMQTRDGRFEMQDMKPGVVNLIPGEWAHRTVNTGETRLVFLGVWPADAGHDYDSVYEQGFARLVLATADGPQVVPNPAYRGR